MIQATRFGLAFVRFPATAQPDGNPTPARLQTVIREQLRDRVNDLRSNPSYAEASLSTATDSGDEFLLLPNPDQIIAHALDGVANDLTAGISAQRSVFDDFPRDQRQTAGTRLKTAAEQLMERSTFDIIL